MIIAPEDFAIHEPDEKFLKVINEKTFDDVILYEKESDFHNIKVIENEIGRFLHFKDTYQAGFIDTPFYKGNLPYLNYFLIPYLINKNIKKVLLVGFGTGKIVNDFEFLFDSLKTIDVVDIEENIYDIAETFFSYKKSDKVNFYLQDCLVYLRDNKKKYDLIVVDVASDEGIDERFISDEYLKLIKKSLAKNGIFVSNLFSSPDFESPKNTLFKRIKKLYDNNFLSTFIFKGNMSDKVYYKSFFNLDNRVIDITNLILISSESQMIIRDLDKMDRKKFEFLRTDIEDYVKDLH